MIYSVILAGGQGTRLKSKTPKQFLKLDGIPIIIRSILAFENNTNIDKIIIVANNEFLDTLNILLKDYSFKKICAIVAGGSNRQESSLNALNACNFNESDILLFHDAVRPFVTDEIINNNIEAVKKYKAAGTYIPATDTIAQISDEFLISVPLRESLFYAQTPQSFEYKLIKDAHDYALKNNITTTDDLSLILLIHKKIKVVLGNPINMKITNPIDISIGESILSFLKTN